MKISFLTLSSGSRPVEDFLNELTPKAHKKVTKRLEYLETYGLVASLQIGTIEKIKSYKKYKLYEYKIKHDRLEYRFLCHIDKDECKLVHAFVKKTRRIRQKEIQTAVSRIKNYIY